MIEATGTDSLTQERRAVWAAGLTLPGQRDLQTSLVGELAAYLDLPPATVEARCRTAAADLARHWHAAAPTTPADIRAFYRQTDLYLYDLTWWHTLHEDASALVQAEALRTALSRGAQTVLDFGSGIGSLGLLMASHGLTVSLTDINPVLNAYACWRFARRSLTVQLCEPADDVLADNSAYLPSATFDFISAVDVFEHLPDPQATMATLCAALRPGGTLFIHLPSQPDDAHPMHLWHNPDKILCQLHTLDLWLERITDATLILRRGDGPRYRLNTGLTLLPDEAGGTLLSTRPLLALKLNPHAFELLQRLNGSSTTAEICAGQAGSGIIETSAFLDKLAQRRLLVKQPPFPTTWPTVSVILPAHGRPDMTRACVESLLHLDYPTDRLEIIVVDDASDPPLALALDGLPVRVIRQDCNIGQSAARNLAAGEATGEVLAFIDNDCIANRTWVRTLVAAMADTAADIVGGRVDAPAPGGPVAAFEAVRSPLDMGPVGGAVGPAERVAYMPTCNLAVRRAAMLQLQGFDAAMLLGEDVDFIWRALQTGSQAYYVPDARIVHHHRVQLGELLRRRADYGSSEADLQQRHPQHRRVMVVPVVAITLLITLVIASIAWLFCLPLVAFAVLLITVESRRKMQRLRQARVCLPITHIITAIAHEHTAALYHLGANITRYYSLPLLAAMLIWPPLIPAALVLLLVPPIIDHQRLSPQISLPLFIALYWLELIAYQIGVWRGCLHKRTLRPLFPRVRPYL